jgi:hypothetical protein
LAKGEVPKVGLWTVAVMIFSLALGGGLDGEEFSSTSEMVIGVVVLDGWVLDLFLRCIISCFVIL